MKLYRIYISLILSIITFTCIQAQNGILDELRRNNPGEGTVTIHQDPRIEALVGKARVRSTTGESSVKGTGYRVQVYAGNNSRAARDQAMNMAARVKQYFPDATVYTTFVPPRWICRVGDYQSYEEADAMMRRLRGTGAFKEVFIIKEQINIDL